MSSITDQLASASGQKEQSLNVALAQKIATEHDVDAVKELIHGLNHKTKAIRHDCIKTLYEIAAIGPSLICPFVTTFTALLDNKDNRLQWGAMTALSAITAEVPDRVFAALAGIMSTADNGSVITRDHCVRILAILSAEKKYAVTAFPLFLEQILQAPVNQVPSYAEQALPVMPAGFKTQFEKILNTRLKDIDQESKKKRVEKILKKLK